MTLKQTILSCDVEGCKKNTSLAHVKFEDRIRKIRALGWETYTDGKVWKHRCPDCQKKAQQTEDTKRYWWYKI